MKISLSICNKLENLQNSIDEYGQSRNCKNYELDEHETLKVNRMIRQLVDLNKTMSKCEEKIKKQKENQ